MEIKLVEGSSNIKAVGYEDNKLLVQYTNGTYLYEGVKKETYEALLNAPSKGGYIYSMIRNKYKTTKLEQ